MSDLSLIGRFDINDSNMSCDQLQCSKFKKLHGIKRLEKYCRVILTITGDLQYEAEWKRTAGIFCLASYLKINK